MKILLSSLFPYIVSSLLPHLVVLWLPRLDLHQGHRRAGMDGWFSQWSDERPRRQSWRGFKGTGATHERQTRSALKGERMVRDREKWPWQRSAIEAGATSTGTNELRCWESLSECRHYHRRAKSRSRREERFKVEGGGCCVSFCLQSRLE